VRIAVIAGSGLSDEAHTYFPHAEIIDIPGPREFFSQDESMPVADALLFSAESGSAWTMLYPSYQVTTPLLRLIRVPVVMPYAGESDPVMDEFIDNWVMLKRNDGTIDKIYDYWILGKGTELKEPRWSVIRNVLHWVD
jgi:proton glutamate symport protein